MSDSEGRIRLGPRCQIVDPAPYLQILADRFGMDPEWFTRRYRFFTGGKKHLYSLARGPAVPRGPEIAFSGIKFMRISMKVPKLTTEAAVAFGFLAGRNVVELDAATAGRYFAREEITLPSLRTQLCTGPGYALVRVGGITVGTGYLHTEDEEIRLRSWFPKHWSEVIRIR